VSVELGIQSEKQHGLRLRIGAVADSEFSSELAAKWAGHDEIVLPAIVNLAPTQRMILLFLDV
jgi:hypothetical protein